MNPRTKNRRFLLKATLGTGAVLSSVIACSSSPDFVGTVPERPFDAGPDVNVSPCASGECGTIAVPPDAGPDAPGPCEAPNFCGIVPLDAGPDADKSSDAGDAGHSCADGGGCGAIANPPDAGDASDQ